MRRRLNRYILMVCSIMSLLPMAGYAADSTARPGMSDAQWQQMSNDPTFGYRNEREYVMAEPKKNDTSFAEFWDHLLDFFRGGPGQIILWGILFAIVAYLVYYIALSKNGSFFFSRTKKIATAGEEPAEDLEDISRTNWDNLIQEAVRTGNYRLAVRYSYIRLLQILQEQELIAYRNDKTNFEYYNELSNTPYKPAFKQLSRQYEYAWYGHFALPEDSFRQYMQEFNELKNQLSR